MTVNCMLCGEPLSDPEGYSRCHCGRRLDDGCLSAHDDWCPTSGRDAWVGVQEF